MADAASPSDEQRSQAGSPLERRIVVCLGLPLPRLDHFERVNSPAVDVVGKDHTIYSGIFYTHERVSDVSRAEYSPALATRSEISYVSPEVVSEREALVRDENSSGIVVVPGRVFRPIDTRPFQRGEECVVFSGSRNLLEYLSNLKALNQGYELDFTRLVSQSLGLGKKLDEIRRDASGPRSIIV